MLYCTSGRGIGRMGLDLIKRVVWSKEWCIYPTLGLPEPKIIFS
jgi:hypothetical protein